MTTHAAAPSPSPRTYFLVFAALLGFTALTVAMSFVHLPEPWHTIVGLAIAGVKAALVVMFFMHVLHGDRLVWLFVGGSLLWFCILLALTLSDYLAGDLAAIPTLAILGRKQAAVRARVVGWCERLRERGVEAEPVDVEGRVGGGTFAEEPLPSCAAWIRLPEGADLEKVARKLRTGEPAVMARIAEDRLLLDGRTVLDGEEEQLLEAVAKAAVATG